MSKNNSLNVFRNPMKGEKNLEQSSVDENSLLNSGIFDSSSKVSALSSQTPAKKRNAQIYRKTPAKSCKTNNNLVNSINNVRTPSRNNTPIKKNSIHLDRFIPNRQINDFEQISFMISQSLQKQSDKEESSPKNRDRKKEMSSMLFGENFQNKRVLNFTNPTQSPNNNSRNISSLSSSIKKSSRNFPQTPERILDAPDLMDDFYLNLIDWSENNLLAVALGVNLYIWDSSTGEISHLLELVSPSDYISSVKWNQTGHYLAVGNSQGHIEIWNVATKRKTRLMLGHEDRVGALSWNEHILTSGSKTGKIFHSDVRVQNHIVKSLTGHSQEVCGLSWSPNGRLLASGGNDNLINIWDCSGSQRFSNGTPLLSLNEHNSAVKALAWCPWQSNLLASGGGSQDCKIHLWNCNTGSTINTIKTKSQVCSLVWSEEYKELVSSHGNPKNEISIWKYPSLKKSFELVGHTGRVLSLSLNSDRTTLVSAGADETLRLWKCFPRIMTNKTPNKDKSQINSLWTSIR